MGGTPNPGTPKDKRLKENQPSAGGKPPIKVTGAKPIDFSKLKKN